MSETLAAPLRRSLPQPLRPGLVTELILAAVASVLLIGGLLFLGIDHFVSQRFAEFAAQRQMRAGQQVQAAIGRELAALDHLAELLSHDAELANATYYHLYLEGEASHPAQAVARIARTFQLDAVRLWESTGRLIAAAPALTPPVSPPSDLDRGEARVVWIDGTPWLAASAPVSRAGNPMALLWLARPLGTVVAEMYPSQGEIRVALARPDAPASGQRLTLPTAGSPVWLDVRVDDSVERALAQVKRLLAWLMPSAGALLALILGITLRRRLAPLAELTAAVGAVGRGEFRPVAPVAGNNEIARLVTAFNTMTADLARLRELERQMEQQARLSAIGRMAARVAHDINNPLSVIRGVAELDAREAERSGNEARLKDARLVLHHVERCMRTVDQLLAYGRPVRLQTELADLAPLCRAIVGRWQTRHPDVIVESREGGEPLPVSVDAYQLERVLDNLLDNARDAAPNAPISVRLAREGDHAVLRVRDQGPGFSAEARAHLFEPFYTTKRGGSGLGLASAAAIVHAHGGSLALGEGPGGELILRLPLQVQRSGR